MQNCNEKKEDIFCTAYLSFISMYSVLNTLSEYTYFYISEKITSYTFLLLSKFIESL